MNYGNIEFKLPDVETSGRRKRPKHCWVITCEPHIRNRLKRVFASVNQTSISTVSLSDTPENARELLWFIDRYPMTVSDLGYLKEQAERHESMERRIANLLSAVTPPASFELAIPPREYQSFAANLLETRRGLLLGDELGLGKSVVGICPMSDQKNLPALVVTLTHLQVQWQRYLARFAPQLKTHILKKGTPYDLVQGSRKRGEKDSRMPDVIICNYHKLSGWQDELSVFIKFVTFDEVHELRNTNSLKYVAAHQIASQAQLRLGLSATPTFNYGSEMYPIMDVLLPGCLGTREEFEREWCSGEVLKDPSAFGAYLRREGLFLARTRKDVGRELPPSSQFVYEVEADLEHMEKVRSSAVELAQTILKTNQSFQNEKMLAAGQFNMLMRQATGIAKAPAVADFVKMRLATTNKVLLFGWHKEVYKIWQEKLAEFKPVLYTGDESPTQKEESRKAFIEGDSRVLIISLRAGAGLDGLQDVCRTAIFGELDWSPSVHEQCKGRIERDPSEWLLSKGFIGQLDPAFMYFLVANEGSDPFISDILGLKKEQLDGVRYENRDEIKLTEIDPDHMKHLAADYLKRQGISVPTAPARVEPELEVA